MLSGRSSAAKAQCTVHSIMAGSHWQQQPAVELQLQQRCCTLPECCLGQPVQLENVTADTTVASALYKLAVQHCYSIVTALLPWHCHSQHREAALLLLCILYSIVRWPSAAAATACDKSESLPTQSHCRKLPHVALLRQVHRVHTTPLTASTRRRMVRSRAHARQCCSSTWSSLTMQVLVGPAGLASGCSRLLLVMLAELLRCCKYAVCLLLFVRLFAPHCSRCPSRPAAAAAAAAVTAGGPLNHAVEPTAAAAAIYCHAAASLPAHLPTIRTRMV
jgi:hypothetical protein